MKYYPYRDTCPECGSESCDLSVVKEMRIIMVVQCDLCGHEWEEDLQ